MGQINIEKFEEAYYAGEFKFIKYRRFDNHTKEHIYQVGEVIKDDYGDSYLYIKEFQPVEGGLSFMYWDFQSFNFSQTSYISFEDAFEIVNDDVKEELLFNLDIFNAKN